MISFDTVGNVSFVMTNVSLTLKIRGRHEARNIRSTLLNFKLLIFENSCELFVTLDAISKPSFKIVKHIAATPSMKIENICILKTYRILKNNPNITTSSAAVMQIGSNNANSFIDQVCKSWEARYFRRTASLDLDFAEFCNLKINGFIRELLD